MFRDLEVAGDSAALDGLVDRVSSTLPSGWTRDLDRDRNHGARGDVKLLAFRRKAGVAAPDASLFLARRPDRFWVTNIVAVKASPLTRSQYNAILEDFAERAVRPAADELGLPISISEEQVPITRWISEEAAIRLRRFSNSANKGTGSSHPLDFERWAAFLIQVHREKSDLTAETLQQWLVEEAQWPADTADSLALEFRFARDLLTAYDRER